MGSPLNFLVMNKMNGSIVATINAGGADQIAYDPVTNRYYSAASRWNPTGKVLATGGACSSAAVCTPVVQIIDAASHKVVDQILVGNNAHSIAVSGNDHKFFMPYSSGTSPGGCQDCAAAYPNGGVSVFQTQ
jgi:DNA-binding beta-propeller fold protein YncE